ncbi:hypothetical protein Nepgr_032790 [Nepenthes gracilis]|uniref:Uncharacterized protein n=1 Tax=Nepenthes gracilis TaxID=150966 RepID=A0AAD3TLI0_NEPGR|nr:hypothetical protein Nepgr_032790 [Nepenthes gracilis]
MKTKAILTFFITLMVSVLLLINDATAVPVISMKGLRALCNGPNPPHGCPILINRPPREANGYRRGCTRIQRCRRSG